MSKLTSPTLEELTAQAQANPREFVDFARNHYGLVTGAVSTTNSTVGMDASKKIMAFDATAPTNPIQSGAVLQGNAGIPAYLSQYLDPEMVHVVTAVLAAVDIVGSEVKKGDWTTDSALFPVNEALGETSVYGDFAKSGRATTNTNWEPRQAFRYQIFTEWGDLELEKAALGKINQAAEINRSAALAMNIFQNETYFYGVSGLENYGLLNDPSLTAPLTPLAGAWSASTITGVQILADVKAMFAQLQFQLQGNVRMDSPMTLAMSTLTEAVLATSMQNVYGTASIKEYLQKVFPKMVFKVAPQYSTSSGNLVQLILDEVQGQKTAICAFTEKLRAHAIVRETSSTHQKKSGGTLGTVIKFPAGIVQLLGV